MITHYVETELRIEFDGARQAANILLDYDKRNPEDIFSIQRMDGPGQIEIRIELEQSESVRMSEEVLKLAKTLNKKYGVNLRGYWVEQFANSRYKFTVDQCKVSLPENIGPFNPQHNER